MSRHETVEKRRDLLFYLEKGANVVAKDKDGCTAMYWAAWSR
jgi:hypothetical protein